MNVPVADGAVTAGNAEVVAVAGARSPWVENTRQYLVPGVSEVTGTDGKCCWTTVSSMFENDGSLAISMS